jgi:cell division protein FtsZ
VVYEEVPYEEDDFIIIDTDEKMKEIEVESEEVEPSEKEPTLFSFDLPLKKEKPEASKGEKEKYQEKKIVHDLDEKTKNIKVNEEIEIVPTTGADGTKRYSLDDYMDFEKEMETAKPRKNNTVAEPDENIVFEKKTTSEKETKKQPSDDSDPFDNPISESLIARAAERREKMKNFNYKFRNSNQNLEEIQKQPAYKRAGIDLDKDEPTDKKMSRTSIEKDEDGEPKLRSNNSFLHDNVD